MLAAMLVLVVWKAAPVLTWVVENPRRQRRRLVLVATVVAAWAALIVTLPGTWRQVIATVPPRPAAILGIAYLVATTMMYVHRRRRLPEDLIEPPLDRPTPPNPSVPTRHWLPLAIVFPAATLVISIIAWLIP